MAQVSGITGRLTIILLVSFYLNSCHGLKQRRQTPEGDETFRFCGNEHFPGLCFTAEKAAKHNCLSLEEDFNCPDETLCCNLPGGKSSQEDEREAAETLLAKRSLTEDDTDFDPEEESDENLETRVRREDVEEKDPNKISKKPGSRNGDRAPMSQDGRKRGEAGTDSQSGRRDNANQGKGRNGPRKAANTNDAGSPSAKDNKDSKKVSVKQQTCKMTKICKRRSGTCRTKCLSGETAKGKCRGKGCMCCITAASCTSTAQCKKAKGKCAAKCKKSEREVPSGCTGDASCLCCGKKCQPKPGCTAAGGTCVEKEADCAGIFQLNGCKFGCHCCAPSK
ncbi:uncharacterized protein LOC135199206 isoform X2 [Macrobrachium nipponense]|uniref:uncharacterized protein LOC135199206 isoform X2 n=1 Tax=Macrobrachium nipponense TaxID=159736 RepID=UPI0030C87099